MKKKVIKSKTTKNKTTKSKPKVKKKTVKAPIERPVKRIVKKEKTPSSEKEIFNLADFMEKTVVKLSENNIYFDITALDFDKDSGCYVSVLTTREAEDLAKMLHGRRKDREASMLGAVALADKISSYQDYFILGDVRENGETDNINNTEENNG